MSGKTWVVSDTHFGHWGVCTFLRGDGTKLRPWDNPDEMDEVMVDNWNKVVSPKDRVYHLGDVVINRRALETVGRLNGRLCLIKGNHDIFNVDDYLAYFDDIRAYNIIKHDDKMVVMSHIPVHPQQLRGRFSYNIHGHMHDNKVMIEDRWGEEIEDTRYINACIEHTNYTPKLLQELLKEQDVLRAQTTRQVLGA